MKNIKKLTFNRLIIFIIAIICFSAGGSAFAEYKILGVTAYARDQSKWCWIAAAKMTGEYHNNIIRNPSNPFYASQADICYYVKGNTNNQGGSVYDTQSATYYAGKYSYYPCASNSNLSFSSLKTQIDNNKPVIAHLFPLNMDGEIGGMGHTEQIYGYSSSTTGSYLYYVETRDGDKIFEDYYDFLGGAITNSYGTLYWTKSNY